MTIFERVFSTPSPKVPNWIAYVAGAVAFAGFFDSFYLTAQKLAGAVPPCSLTAGFSCDTVLTSSYAQVLGIPVSAFGVLYYLAVLWCAVLYLTKRHSGYLLGMLILPFAGLGASAWFLYLQAYVLNAYCLYCLFSAALTLLLVVAALILWYRVVRNENNSAR